MNDVSNPPLFPVVRVSPARKPARRLTPFRARRILGLPKKHTHAAIRKAWRRLSALAHPDRVGSDEKMKELTEARDLLLKVTPPVGRPRKHARISGYVIIDQHNKVHVQGFPTRKVAEAALAAMPKSPARSSLPEDDKTGKKEPLYLRVAGNAVAERQRAKRARDKDFIYNEKATKPDGLTEGTTLKDGTPILCGGYSPHKISAIDAAHRAHVGGPMANAITEDIRLPARCTKPKGNGIDADHYDASEDALDMAQSLSAPDRDCLRETWERDSEGRLFIEGLRRDMLYGSSVEERELPGITVDCIEAYDGSESIDTADFESNDTTSEGAEPEFIESDDPEIDGFHETGLPASLEDFIEECDAPLVLVSSKPTTSANGTNNNLAAREVREIEWDSATGKLIIQGADDPIKGAAPKRKTKTVTKLISNKLSKTMPKLLSQ